MIFRILFLAILLGLSSASPASAYGKSVEDLVGSFSISKEIKIGSSSDCFSSEAAPDPLAPPMNVLPGPLSDDLSPSIAGLTIQPGQISLATPQPVNITAHIIDDQSVWGAEAVFFGPEGERAAALFSPQNISQGTARDGFYPVRLALPANKTGEWHLQNLTLVDGEGNRKTLSEADLMGLGLPTLISVI